MVQISLRFLGEFSVLANDLPITGFRSDKARALLAYLTLEPRRHTRNAIAGLLWPDVSSNSALTNLRNTLYRLRMSVEGVVPGAADALLEVTRQGIRLKQATTTVDVLEFEQLLETARISSTADAATHSRQLERLHEITSLYRGDLLAGFAVNDAPDFDEWLLIRREVLQQRAIVAFSTLASGYERIGQTQQAYQVATQLLALDAYREESYRQVMRCLATMGQPELALNHYLQMRRSFQEEMGVSPTDETLDLVAAIKGGAFAQVRTATSDTAPIAAHMVDPDDATLPTRAAGDDAAPPRRAPASFDIPEPGNFFGRGAESRQMHTWVQEGCHVIAVVGIGGVGKTSLVAHWARELIDPSVGGNGFDHIIWRSLVNAPPLMELLVPLLQLLSAQRLVNLPESIDERLRLLLQYMLDQRVLLVLDNFESIMDPQQPSAYRHGYEDYGQLFEFVMTRQHDSHLVITSRERPAGTARLVKDGRSLRVLQLDGLDIAATHELLTSQGLRAQAEEEAQLMTRYSGNPLALKLVADTVSEIFGGESSEFLMEETPIFDDVRSVLDQQFARLSPLGQSILYALAVAREAMPAASLRAELLVQPNPSHFIESLRRLQRHSLIVRQADGFVLQNVVMEYVTDRLIGAVYAEILHTAPDLLHTQPLLKATSKEYVRQSQARLILMPLGERLLAHFGSTAFASHVQQLIAQLRVQMADKPSYAAGNLLNLLVQMNFDLVGYSFAGLNIRQSDLQHASLYDVDFSGAWFADTALTNSFGAIQCLAISPPIDPQAPAKTDTQPLTRSAQPRDLLAAGTTEGDIRLWRLDSAAVEGVLASHAGIVYGVAFAPEQVDGQSLLASAHADGAIVIWNLANRTTLKTLQGHGGSAISLAFLPNSTRFPNRTVLASGSEDHTILLWDIHSGDLLQRIDHHRDWVTCLAFDPQRMLLASSDRAGNVFLWQFEDFDASAAATDAPRQPSASLPQQEHAILTLAFSPDGKHLASAGMDRTVCLWDVATRQLRFRFEGHATVRSVAFSPDSTQLASGSADGNVRIWDVQEGRPLDTLRGHTRALRAALYNHAGDTLISGGLDDAIRVWSLRDAGHAQATYHLQGHRDRIQTLVCAPDGVSFYTGTQSGLVARWDVRDAVMQQRPQVICMHQHEVKAIALHPTQSLLVSAGFDKAIYVSDPRNPMPGQALSGHTDDIYCVEFTADGKLLVSAGTDGRILLWHVGSNGSLRLHRALINQDWHVTAMACSPTDPLIVTGDMDTSLSVWRIETGEPLSVAVDEPYLSTSLAFHPAGTLLASAELSGRIHLLELCDLDLSRNQLRIIKRHTLGGHRAAVNQVCFSRDGRLVASGGGDHVARIWDVATGELCQVLTGHRSAVRALDFGVDGKTLLTGAPDGMIKFWHLDTGECLNTLTFPGPYDGMNIQGATGLTPAQRQSLKALGAVEMP